MGSERRHSPRYPTWLPGTVMDAEDGTSSSVRVVDLSLAGAAIEGAPTPAADQVLVLRIDWSGLAVTLRCRVIDGTATADFPITRVEFAETSEVQRLGLAALVGAMAADFHDDQRRFVKRPNRPATVLPFKRREDVVRHTRALKHD